MNTYTTPTVLQTTYTVHALCTWPHMLPLFVTRGSCSAPRAKRAVLPTQLERFTAIPQGHTEQHAATGSVAMYSTATLRPIDWCFWLWCSVNKRRSLHNLAMRILWSSVKRIGIPGAQSRVLFTRAETASLMLTDAVLSKLPGMPSALRIHQCNDGCWNTARFRMWLQHSIHAVATPTGRRSESK